MNIEIKNCNNIDRGSIELIEGRLNIKYAINGTGKSTISKVLEAYIKNDDSQKKALLPFKYYEATSTITPEIFGAEKFNRNKYVTTVKRLKIQGLSDFDVVKLSK